MITNLFQESTRLVVVSTIAAVSLVGGVIGLVPPAAAQTATFPDASNTGVLAGVARDTVSGNVTLSSGMTYQNKTLTGCIDVTGSNVTIKNVKISCNGTGISVPESGVSGVVIQDVEIVCTAAPGAGGRGIDGGNYTVRRANAYGCDDTMWANGNVVIEDSYLHDPAPTSGGSHTDVIQLWTGVDNVTVRHNTLQGRLDTSSVMTTGCGHVNLFVENNLMWGGVYTLRVCEAATGGNTNSRVVNNRFSTALSSKVGLYGPFEVFTVPQVCGNVYHETGQLLSGQKVCAEAPSPPSELQVIQ